MPSDAPHKIIVCDRCGERLVQCRCQPLTDGSGAERLRGNVFKSWHLEDAFTERQLRERLDALLDIVQEQDITRPPLASAAERHDRWAATRRRLNLTVIDLIVAGDLAEARRVARGEERSGARHNRGISRTRIYSGSRAE